MIDKLRPYLTGNVIAMVERSKTEQQREIQEVGKNGWRRHPDGMTRPL